MIDNSFPTKQLSIRQFDVTNTTPKAITDFRAFSCDDHEIFKKNIGPIYLNDKKINPEFVTVRKRTIRYMHSWESGNNTLTANYECLPSNYYLYDTAYPVQNLNLRLYLKIRTLKTPTLYRSPDMSKIAEMTYVERSGNFYYLEDQKLAPGGYELIW